MQMYQCLVYLTELDFYVKLVIQDSFFMRFYFYGRKRIHNTNSNCAVTNRRHTLRLKSILLTVN
jgi:hypothetical protein